MFLVMRETDEGRVALYVTPSLLAAKRYVELNYTGERWEDARWCHDTCSIEVDDVSYPHSAWYWSYGPDNDGTDERGNLDMVGIYEIPDLDS